MSASLGSTEGEGIGARSASSQVHPGQNSASRSSRHRSSPHVQLTGMPMALLSGRGCPSTTTHLSLQWVAGEAGSLGLVLPGNLLAAGPGGGDRSCCHRAHGQWGSSPLRNTGFQRAGNRSRVPEISMKGPLALAARCSGTSIPVAPKGSIVIIEITAAHQQL